MTTQEIKNGMKLLDEKAPELLSEQLGYKVDDWRPLINKDKLNLKQCHRCILGQLFGYYDNGLNKLGLDYYFSEDRELTTSLGFSLPFGSSEQEYNKLTQQWKEALSEEQHDNQG